MMLDDWLPLSSGAFWQMSMAEKAAFRWLIGQLAERCIAIEAGSFCGGSLRVLDQTFTKVFSLDVDHSRLRREDYRYTEFITGDSQQTLPALLDRLKGETINLVLIDADHSYNAVLSDINAVLRYRPLGQMLLLMHDSWDANVRLAIDHAAWQDCPYVQAVEKDFCVGDLGSHGFVGGLAVAVLAPTIRTEALVIGQTHDYMYRTFLGEKS